MLSRSRSLLSSKLLSIPRGMKLSSPIFMNKMILNNQIRFYSNSPSYPKNVIQEKILDILSKHDSIKSTPTKDSHLVQDLGLDSLDAAEIIFQIENEFVLEIDDEVAFTLQSVPQIVDFVYHETHHH
ncbi:hypothetical protein ABK040_004651 [Willaertia magna]